jgi:hypothetical protein
MTIALFPFLVLYFSSSQQDISKREICLENCMMNTLSIIIFFPLLCCFNYCEYAGAFPLELGEK